MATIQGKSLVIREAFEIRGVKHDLVIDLMTAAGKRLELDQFAGLPSGAIAQINQLAQEAFSAVDVRSSLFHEVPSGQSWMVLNEERQTPPPAVSERIAGIWQTLTTSRAVSAPGDSPAPKPLMKVEIEEVPSRPEEVPSTDRAAPAPAPVPVPRRPVAPAVPSSRRGQSPAVDSAGRVFPQPRPAPRVSLQPIPMPRPPVVSPSLPAPVGEASPAPAVASAQPPVVQQRRPVVLPPLSGEEESSGDEAPPALPVPPQPQRRLPVPSGVRLPVAEGPSEGEAPAVLPVPPQPQRRLPVLSGARPPQMPLRL